MYFTYCGVLSTFLSPRGQQGLALRIHGDSKMKFFPASRAVGMSEAVAQHRMFGSFSSYSYIGCVSSDLGRELEADYA